MTTAVLLCKALRNEPVQLGIGIAVPFKFPLASFLSEVFYVYFFFLALCFLAVFLSKFSNMLFSILDLRHET